MENGHPEPSIELVPASWDIDAHGNTVLTYNAVNIMLIRNRMP